MSDQPKPDAQSGEMSAEEREELRRRYREAVRNCWKDESAIKPRKGGTQTTAERLEAKIDKLIARMDRLEGRAAVRESECND